MPLKMLFKSLRKRYKALQGNENSTEHYFFLQGLEGEQSGKALLWKKG